MNKNLFWKELKRNRMRFLIWAAMLSAFILVTVALVPNMAATLKLQAILDVLPKEISLAFGIDPANWTNPLGVYVTYHIFYALLFAAIFSVSLGMELLSKEEGRRTAEFLLTRPLGRSEIVWSKTGVLVVYVVALNAVMTLVALVGFAAFVPGPIDTAAFFVLSGYTLLLNLAIAALGLFVSLLVKRGRATMSIGVGLVLGSYFLDAFAKAAPKVEALGWLSPFRFVDTGVLQAGYGFQWWRILYFLGFITVFLALTFFRYRKKDILI